MSTAEIRNLPLRVVLFSLFANLAAIFAKVLFHEDFYDHVSYPHLVLVCGATGFLFSIVTLALALKCLTGGWRAAGVIGSLLTTFWWFSDITWWVATK